MKKLLVSLVMVVLSAHFVCADEYRVIHRPGLFEAVGNLMVTAVTLPVAVVGGIAVGAAQGFEQLVTGGDEVVLVRDQPSQLVVYYGQPMYGVPPIDPGYQISWWSWEPNGIIFAVGNQRVFRNFNHGGSYGGNQFRHRNNTPTPFQAVGFNFNQQRQYQQRERRR